ncbi:MAG: prepilin peptidase [Deltaproteobacteria bacterium]|nr:prepilin peptidase [Deltaproteobacteria bacterium]
MYPELYTPVFLFCLGAIIGSFLNVCIVRIPQRMSIVFPASHCPSCTHKIPVYDNIPLLSYLILGGRCRFCKTPIALTYFLVELITPILFLVLWHHFGLSSDFLISATVTAALIVITVIDLQHQIIPDVISLPGIPICFLCSFVVSWTTPLQSLLGILCGGGVLFLFAWGYQRATGKDGMGGGDIKLLAMIGALLGWKGALTSLILASCIGSIIGIILIIAKGKNMKYAIPFGPFLATGAVCALMYGEQLISFYLNLGA